MTSPLPRIPRLTVPVAFLSFLVLAGCGKEFSFQSPELVREWGGNASDDLYPYRLLVANDQVLVMEVGGVKRYSLDGQLLGVWGLAHGEDMALGKDGHLYVSTQDRHVKVYTPEGRLVRDWLVGESTNQPGYQLWGIDLDSQGNVHVVDRANRIVHVYTAEGSPVRTWGMAGGDFPGLQSPSSLLILSDGSILVADRVGTSKTHVLEFSQDGNYRRTWADPAGVYDLFQLHDGTVVVANPLLPRYTRDGAKLVQWGQDESGRNYFRSVNSVTETESGRLFVGDVAYHTITQFDADGQVLSEWRAPLPPGRFRSLTAVEAHGDFVYTLESDVLSRVQKLTRDGTPLQVWGGTGSRPGQLYFPTDLAVDASGLVYVSDPYNRRITRFDAGGGLLGSWGAEDVRQIAVGPEGSLYTASKNRIQRLSADGELLYSLAPASGNNFDFQGLDVGPSGKVYVVDVLGAEVHVFSPKGQELNTWFLVDSPKNDWDNFLDLVVDPKERIIISDANGSRVDLYGSGGQHLGTWSGDRYSQDPGNPFNRPRGMDVDAQGDLWVVDMQGGLVRHFGPLTRVPD